MLFSKQHNYTYKHYQLTVTRKNIQWDLNLTKGKGTGLMVFALIKFRYIGTLFPYAIVRYTENFAT